MSTYDGNAGQVSVLILGGWSPGPLLYLKRGLQGRCVFLEPSIPMPPIGFSWCLSWGMGMLAVAIAGTVVICTVLADFIVSRALLAVTRLAMVLVCMVLVRFCVAVVVRGSISRGVHSALACMRQQDVRIAIGFSWGGGILAEMLQLGLLGGPGQPSALLIAPTNALMAKVAMRKDAALTVRVPNDMAHRVHVFVGTDDEAFCPHSDRWELTGATTHVCHDNHVFCRRESLDELRDVLVKLVRDEEC